MRRPLPLVVLGILIAICAALVRAPREDRRLSDDALLLPRAELVRGLAMPILHLVADYFWVMTTHQIGEAVTAQQHRDIYSYADLLTDLDPKFRQPYLVAGVTIPFKEKDGTWLFTDESTRLLEKGIEQFPDYVYLRIMLAYNHTQFHRNYRRAAEIIAVAARIPDAPPYLAPLATRLYASAGEFDAGMMLAASLAETAETEEMREAFAARVRELQLEKILREVDAAAAQFAAREGRPPGTVQDLVSAGLLTELPPDPLGGEIVLDDAGRARSTAQQRRLTDFTLPDSEARP